MTRSAPMPYLQDSLPGRRGWPLAFAHRGADTARENTLGAFRDAVERGYGYLELDVRTTADGVLVVFHDETLDRVTTGTGRFSDHTWEQLRRVRVVDPAGAVRAAGAAGTAGSGAAGSGAAEPGAVSEGEPLLAFDDLLAAWPDVRLNVDLKDDAAAEAIVPLIARHDAWDRVLIASFHDSRRRRFTRAAGRRIAMSGGWLAIAALVAAAPVGLTRLVGRRLAHVDCVQVPVRQGPVTVVTERFVSRCQAAGLQVHVWVVDEPAEMERLLALGVDGLMTDDVEALASVMEARGHWPQRRRDGPDEADCEERRASRYRGRMTHDSPQIPSFIAEQALSPASVAANVAAAEERDEAFEEAEPAVELPVPAGHAVATGTEEAGAAVGRMRQAATVRLAHPRRFRAAQLKGLRRMLEEEADAICAALAADLGKSTTEALVTEIQPVRAEVDHALLYLTDWMEPQGAKVPLPLRPAAAKIEARPLGMVLIMAPWNYPLMLLLSPLVAALAAGNTVVLKPSERAPATSALIGRLLPQYLDPRGVAVVQGGAETVQQLLAEKFDHIFFTGGERVGRIVYEAAARQLTPVTLELGGKSPCVVADGRNWGAIARRIAFGKFTNAGQTCVAPDYVLAVGEEAQRQLEKHLPRAIEEFYGADPQQSPDYGRMVDADHLERMVSLLEGALSGEDRAGGAGAAADAAAGGAAGAQASAAAGGAAGGTAAGRGPARLVHGGRHDAADLFLEPTVVSDVPVDCELMTEEIFGPVLPIIRVETFEEAVEFVTARPHPLAAYLFTDRHRYHRAFEERVTAGGMAFDVTLLQVGLVTLPFGGVGPSGMGAYHGRTGFETFSQLRPALTKTDQVDTLRMAYPPYTWAKRQALKHML